MGGGFSTQTHIPESAPDHPMHMEEEQRSSIITITLPVKKMIAIYSLDDTPHGIEL